MVADEQDSTRSNWVIEKLTLRKKIVVQSIETQWKSARKHFNTNMYAPFKTSQKKKKQATKKNTSQKHNTSPKNSTIPKNPASAAGGGLGGAGGASNAEGGAGAPSVDPRCKSWPTLSTIDVTVVFLGVSGRKPKNTLMMKSRVLFFNAVVVGRGGNVDEFWFEVLLFVSVFYLLLLKKKRKCGCFPKSQVGNFCWSHFLAKDHSCIESWKLCGWLHCERGAKFGRTLSGVASGASI